MVRGLGSYPTRGDLPVKTDESRIPEKSVKGLGSYSRNGLSNRAAAQEQMQMQGHYIDFDEEIGVLHSKVGQLKNIAQVIETETKDQHELLNQLEDTMAKAQAGVKSAMKRMRKSVIQNGSNHLVHVVLFGLLFFTFVYLWAKFLR